VQVDVYALGAVRELLQRRLEYLHAKLRVKHVVSLAEVRRRAADELLLLLLQLLPGCCI
jgi:hypothetical protein